MLVKCDGAELPAGVTVDVSIGERNQLTIRLPASSPDRFILARLADGQVHVFEWFTNGEGGLQTKYAEAHAKLNFRLSTQYPQQGGASDYVELSGQAWGPPPNYKQVLIG